MHEKATHAKGDETVCKLSELFVVFVEPLENYNLITQELAKNKEKD